MGCLTNLKRRYQHLHIHVAVLLSALLEVLLKWLAAVLFAKTFEKIAESATQTTSIFETRDPIWKALFLRELSFEQTLYILLVLNAACSLTGGYFVSTGRLIAEKLEARRREQVIVAATTGVQISSGSEGKASDQVSVVLEQVSQLYHYEVFTKWEREKNNFLVFFAIILAFVFLPQGCAVVVGIIALNMALQKYIYRIFLSDIDSQVTDIKGRVFKRCLDVARCADVVALNNMEQNEGKAILSENMRAFALQRKRAMIDFFARTFNLFVLGTGLAAALSLVYYLYDRLTDEPIDLVFRLFALITILDQLHKGKIYLQTTEEDSVIYRRTKGAVLAWISTKNIDNFEEGQSEKTSIKKTIKACNKKPEELTPAWEIGDIQLVNVSIVYKINQATEDPEALALIQTTVLRNRDLKFPYGQSTALVGESGSGKSSVLKIISGLLVPSNGNIYLGSLELTHSTRSKIRANMSVCSQDSLLFARTIRENIWYGNDQQCNDEIILQVLENVGLSDWISKQPMGLDQVLTVGEEQVSGGQAQRINLARLFCRDKHYVMLDEACSALDAINRKRILNHMKKYLSGRTSVWVTHHEDVQEAMDNLVDLSREDHYIAQKKMGLNTIVEG